MRLVNYSASSQSDPFGDERDKEQGKPGNATRAI